MHDVKLRVGENLVRYRNGAGLSAERLAARVGVTRQTIYNYETGKTLPDSGTLSRLADAVGVTLDDLLRRQEELPSFRFRAHASFSRKPQLAAQVVRLLREYAWLEQAVGVAPYAPESTPCHRLDEETKPRIEAVAAQFRHRLDLGDGPIVNLFQAVEAIGFKVLRKPFPIEGFFGLSAASADQGAFILVNSHAITIERQLFTLAHEIGHLIFHRGEYAGALVGEGTKEEEQAREEVANHFASHLLVPEEALRRALDKTRSLKDLKSYFRVSYQLILMRMAKPEGPTYGELFQQVAAKYRRLHGQSLAKKVEIPPELQPAEFPENERLRRLVLDALDLGTVTELRAAELLEITIDALRALRKAAREDVTL